MAEAAGNRRPYDLLIALAAGAIFGLSAPGFDQWYLAWICLAPFFLLVAGSDSWKQAGLRGLVFGTAYNLIYLNWYLGLHSLSWMGLNDWQSVLLALACWLIVSLLQGVMYAIFAVVMRMIPLCGGVLPRKVEDRWKLPALIVIPLLFQLAFERVLNAHDFLGVPWSMIEYSQYKQTACIQIACIMGGIGFGAFLVMFNVAIATFIATLSKKFSFKSLAASSRLSGMCGILVLLLILSGSTIYGLERMQSMKLKPDQQIHVVQGNINIEMQKKAGRRYTLQELITHYDRLIAHCPPGICVWTESALPAYLKDSPSLLGFLGAVARGHQVDMVVGSIDSDQGNRPYNSAFGITKNGTLLDEVYHKRFLVPVGEYTPAFVKYLPAVLQKLTDTPAGVGFAAGKKPVVLDLCSKKIAPLICFETIAPEIVASSVRNGGQLIVNISDLAWFHNNMVGDQTEACAVFRAIETSRYFVYAANTGPTLVVDPLGRVKLKSKCGEEKLVSGRVELLTGLTPFVQWYQ